MILPTRPLLPIAAATLALVGLSACSQKSRDDTTQAADSIAADANTTMTHAVNSVDAATDKAFGKAQNATDHAGDTMSNAGDRAGDTLDRTGDSIGNAADRAQHATGRALRNAGDKLDN